MLNLKGQMLRLLAVSALGSFGIAGASWVVLLSARGFSMLQIGVVESVFHVASLLMEVPSGMLADVLGRRRSLMLGRVAAMLSSLLMIISRGMVGVCAAIVFSAFSYSFASGAREALAYDSLKEYHKEEEYLRYSSLEMTVYRIGSAAAVLCAGAALWMGYQVAYLLDALGACVCLVILMGVREVQSEPKSESRSVWSALRSCVLDSVWFLKRERLAGRLMLLNGFLDALAVLLSFFLQARLQQSELAQGLLGPTLFVMGLGGALGARLALRVSTWRFSRVVLLGALGIVFGVMLGSMRSPICMAAGGFLGAVCDDFLQVRADSILNDLFPSEQRATILSVSSLIFSLLMIGLSPLAGSFFAL